MTKYADADEPTCRLCGREAKLIPTEGASHWECEEHGKLNVSDVIGVEPGEFRVGEKP